MKSNLFLRVIIVLFCSFFASTVCAQKDVEDLACKWVEDKGRELVATFGESDIAKKYAQLDDMLVNYIDLDYVAKFVIGKY